ncbi:MAG TPA: PQQ-binding-like beta-propeller repeat protein, partial [Polyangiaceae bacterium]
MPPATRGQERARRPLSRLLECARLLAAALTVSSATGAQMGVDADLVQRATVGPPAATAPTHASAVSRTRRAAFEFPAAMHVLWRARVTGPITLEPVVDDKGRIVLLHERGTLSMLSDGGTTSWSLRLGDATPGVSPALLSDGTVAIYNFDDRLLRIDVAGRLVAATHLGLKGKPAALLPLESGGAALAVGDDLVRVDHRGEVVARASAEHTIAELLSSRGSVIAVDNQGEVYRFHGTGVLSPEGSFGRGVAAVALAGKSLLAVSGGQHLVSFDLDT